MNEGQVAEREMTAEELAKEERKARVKRIRKGQEQLVESDFTLNGEFQEEDFSRYQAAIKRQEENARLTWDDEEFIQKQVETILVVLHSANGPFAKYIPTLRGRGLTKKSRESGIPELDRFNQLTKKVDELFREWRDNLPEYKELMNYLSEELGIDESSTYEKGDKQLKVLDEFGGFDPYWRYIGAVKNYIKQNFAKE